MFNHLKILFVLLMLISHIHGKEKEKRILYLNSYHQSMTWAMDITKGLKDTLQLEKNNYILHIENMDTKRHNSSEYFESLANLYKTKYKDITFDLILASDNNAFDFLKKYRNDIFGNIPVSFSGVNDYQDSMLKGVDKYTGVSEQFSDVETLKLIFKIHPNVKNIYVINDYLKTGRAWEKTIRKNFEQFKNKVNITYSKNLTINELRAHIRNLPKDTVILMGVYYADKLKNYLTFEKVGSVLLDISTVPVYCLLNFNISNGVIGGKVISGYEQGAMMAKLGLSTLQGINPNKIDVVKEGVNKFIFNEIALKKFNIDKSLLPKEHKLINEDKKVIEKYGMTVSIVLTVLSFVFIFVIFMFYKKDITNEKAVLKLLISGPIVFVPTVIAILTYSIISTNQEVHQNDLDKLKIKYLKEQKLSTMNEVEKASEHIYSLKSKKEALDYINEYKYGKNGYLFGLNIKGKMIAHGSMPSLRDKDMIHYQDSKGVNFIQKLINNAITNSLEFTQYIWTNPSTKKTETKYSYSKYIPKYDFIIGSGVYTQDVKQVVDEKTVELNTRNDIQMKNILTISVVIIVLSTILTVVLSNMIKKIFGQYNNVIDTKNKNLEHLNDSLEERIHDEVDKSHKKDSVIFEQSKMASMGDMIGNIAHQWRQPLSIISTASTGIIVKTEYNMMTEDELIKNCELINQNAQYLSQTIEDFKNYIKNDREITHFNLKNNIENLLTLVEASLKTHEINVILDLDENINLNGYPNELIQCMMNIVNNAKDALNNAEGKKVLFISTKKSNDNAEIIFQDNANGIPDDIITKIFEPYFTTKHKSQGTGLGLSMTYNIITQGMRGKIEVKNITFDYNHTTYSGARFTISLPLLV